MRSPLARLLVRALPACVGLSLAAPLGAQEQLTLQRAIEIAQQHGLTAQAAHSTYQSAVWRDRAFARRLLPQLSLNGQLPVYSRDITQLETPAGVFFVPRQTTQGSLNIGLTQQVPLTGGELTMSTGLSRLDVTGGGHDASRTWRSTPFSIGYRQNIFRPNVLKWDGREQDLRATIAARQFAEAKEDVAVATATAFFDAYAARTALQTATSNASVNDSLFNLSKGRFEVGKIGENDLLQAELALLRSRTTLDGAKLDAARTLAVLRIALNMPPDTPIEIVVPSETPMIEIDPELAVAEAVRNGSQSESIELQEVQAKRRVSDAKLSSGVGVTLNASGGYNQSSPLFGGVYDELLQQQRVSVGVDMPLVRWGARKADIESARADERRVASTLRSTRATAQHEARFAALQFMQTQRVVALSAKADTVADKRFEVAKNRYIIGKIGINDLYTAQNEKDNARQGYVTALRGYWLAYYRLRRMTLYDFVTSKRLTEN